MKKFFFSLVAILAVVLVASCRKSSSYSKALNPATNQNEYTAEAAKEFLESGEFTFIIGFDADFPPYGYQDENGELVGFDLDLAREVAKRQGWEIELKPIDWDAKDAELNSGMINCIWNGFTINGREELYTWTDPYVDSSQVILVRRDSGITSKAKLAGKVVEAQADSSGLKALEDESAKEFRASLKKVIEVPNFNQAYMELQSGVCDAVVIDYSVAVRLMSSDTSCVILDETLVTEQYGVGFKLGNTALRDKVQGTLKAMYADGTFRKISEKWFNGDDVSIIKL